MNDGTAGRKFVQSPLARALLVLSCLTVVGLAFYVYQTGLWRQILHFWSYFVAPKKLEAAKVEPPVDKTSAAADTWR